MSTAKFDQWLNPNGTENYKTRAWVNFNGTGTVAIRASGNVASITDNGTGDYTVNFATAMPDTNYATVANGRVNAGTFVSVAGPLSSATQTTSGSRVGSSALGGTVIDSESITVAIFR